MEDAAIEAVLEKSPTSTTILGSLTNFCAIATVWRGSAWLSSNTYCSGRPLTPVLLTSSSARSKPFFHCAPYWAFWPVSGPLTPIVTGSPEACAKAADVPSPHSVASAAAPLIRNRRRRSEEGALSIMRKAPWFERSVVRRDRRERRVFRVAL